MSQLFAVDGNLGLFGAEPDGQPVPARRPGQPLDRKGRAL